MKFNIVYMISPTTNKQDAASSSQSMCLPIRLELARKITKKDRDVDLPKEMRNRDKN
jgi:hypothetical protein